MNPVSNVAITTDNPRGGIDLHFDLSSNDPVQQSASWSFAGRDLRFVRLGPGSQLPVDSGTHYVKVVLGSLSVPDRTCFATPFEVRSTIVTSTNLIAGEEGALFALLTESEEVPQKLRSMSDIQFEGPGSDHLVWQTFEEKFSNFIDIFNGLDCHMMSGIHLLDGSGEEIVYVNFWTCGKGVDLSTHNHGQDPAALSPAFAEVHWVIDAGTATSGMYQTEAPGHPDRVRHHMARGDEHGPFFKFADGRPVLRANGAVTYGWHGWQGGDDDDPRQAYDFVAAFEINPKFAILQNE